jgi:hypothetical protein
MSEDPYHVGYGRPPVHSRFQKGQSGNPGGRPGPEKHLKQHFDVALSDALNADEEALRQAKPGTVLESFARRLALRALEGRPSAERQVLSILERSARDAVTPPAEIDAPRAAARNGAGECRQLLGDRYEEFKARYDKAVRAGSADDLLALAEDFQIATEFPETGTF